MAEEPVTGDEIAGRREEREVGRALSVEHGTELQQVRRLRARQAVDRRDELRLLARLAPTMPFEKMKRALRSNLPELTQRLREAEDVPPVAHGFSGADPYEIAQRYAAGLISREQVVDELARWSYRPHTPGDGYDWITTDPGEFIQTVGRAHRRGLLEDDVYSEILTRGDSVARSVSSPSDGPALD